MPGKALFIRVCGFFSIAGKKEKSRADSIFDSTYGNGGCRQRKGDEGRILGKDVTVDDIQTLYNNLSDRDFVEGTFN